MSKSTNNELKDIVFYARKTLAVPSGSEDNSILAATAMKNLSDYGFTIDQQGVEALSTASKEDITAWYYEASKKLNELVGGNHTYNPFYPNFPEELMDKTSMDLFIDQISHYWTGYKPEDANTKAGVKSLEEHPLKVVATYNDDTQTIYDTAKEIFQNTLRSKTNPSTADMNGIINAYAFSVPEWTKDVSVCENRNVLSYLYAKAINEQKATEGMPKLVTNDYLRIAKVAAVMKVEQSTELNDLDRVEEYHIKSLSRGMRRFIANGLESQANLEEDIARNKPTWKALLQKIHIGEFQSCEKANEVATKLRNNKPLNTFYSRIEKAFSEKNYENVIKMYSSRPGEFIKNFNRLLTVDIEDPARKINYAKELIDASKIVFSKTRPEDLVAFIGYLNARTREDMVPIHNVKGKLVQTEQKYEPIPPKTSELFIKLAKDGIESQIKTGKSYGKVYIDPNMKNMPLPSEVKDATASMNKYPKGARLPIERDENGDSRNVRAFIWWTNIPDGVKVRNEDNYWGPSNRVDLDLSFNLYKQNEDGKLETQGAVSFYSHERDEAFAFSGDITNGGEAGGAGVAEFIDMNIDKLKERGVDFVQMYVNSYSGQPLSQIPCLGGWQERTELDKSSQVDIKAVKQTSELGSGDVRAVTPFIFDVKNEQFIWIDSPDLRVQTATTSMQAMNNINLLMERYAKGDRMTMAEMIDVAIKANGGEVVNTPEEADTIFSVEPYEAKTETQRVITSKDQDVWLGEFMSPQKIDVEAETIIEKEVQVEEDTINSIADAIAQLVDEGKVEPSESTNEPIEEQMTLDGFDDGPEL